MIPVYKGETFLTNFNMSIPQGWNVMTLYESAGEEFEEQYTDESGKGDWTAYINGHEVDDSYEIKEDDMIHFVIQESDHNNYNHEDTRLTYS